MITLLLEFVISLVIVSILPEPSEEIVSRNVIALLFKNFLFVLSQISSIKMALSVVSVSDV